MRKKKRLRHQQKCIAVPLSIQRVSDGRTPHSIGLISADGSRIENHRDSFWRLAEDLLKYHPAVGNIVCTRCGLFGDYCIGNRARMLLNRRRMTQEMNAARAALSEVVFVSTQLEFVWT